MERYPERESKTLEFKEVLPSFASLVKTCVAFANTAGGQIIIGVEDKTRKIVGVSDTDRERLYESFPDSLFDATNNGLFAHIYEKNFNDSSVLVIEVPLNAKRPCFVKSEGLSKGVYLRVGASTRRVGEQHVEQLVRESRHQYFDTELTSLQVDALSQTLLEQCFGKSYSHKKLESEGVIATQAMEHKQYRVTVAGVLMFYERPEKIIPEAQIICTEFAGTTGRDIVQTRELTGPIPQLVNDSTSLLAHWLQRHYQLVGAKLEGKMLVPAEALREAIINGLIHRRYNIPGALKIALYENRLEIFSPGGFPGLVDINNLGDGTTYLRNPHIAMLARRMKLVEKLGTGIRLIFEATQAHGLVPPRYYEDGDFVKLVFEFKPSGELPQGEEGRILNFIRMRREVTIGDIMSLLDVSRNTATRKLNGLIEKDLLVRTGSGPSVRYRRK